MTILVIGLFIGLIYFFFSFSKKLSRNVIEDKSDDRFRPLIDELKNINQMRFKIVSARVIYSNTFSVLFKVVGYLLSFATIALTLDFFTIKHFVIYDYSDLAICIGVYLFASFIVFIGPLLSCTWDYTYFKYGLSEQLKNADIAYDYIGALPAKILKKYPIIFITSYALGRFIDGNGFLSVLIGTFIYELSITLFFALETKRIGFAPVFNLFTEKLNEFKGK